MFSTTRARRGCAAVAAPLLLIVAATAQTNATSPLGTNLAKINYYSTELAFVDLIKQSSAWIPQKVVGGKWDTGEKLAIDANGWIRSLEPGQAAGLLMVRDIEGHYPAGKYLCLFDGDGQLLVGFDGRVTRSSTGRLEVQVDTPRSGIYLKLVRTNPANPLRNIRFIPASAEKTHRTQPFRRAFLDRWKWFRTIRFMEWGRTNTTQVSQWSERTTAQARSQGGATGAAYEYMIDLGNAIDAHPWICIPHLADDDFVRKLAALVQARLQAGLQVYVEYSNEVWNTHFPAYRHAERQGRALKLSSNPYEAALRYYSQRSVEIFKIFEQALGKSRVYGILSGQAVNPWNMGAIADWKQAGKAADAIAVAPYIGWELGSPANAIKTSKMSDLELFYTAYLDIARVMKWVRGHAAHAKRYGIDLITYEGGQGMVGRGAAQSYKPLTDRLLAANRHFAMFYLYDLFLQSWRQAGGRTFVHYYSSGRYSRWGCWGAFEWADQNPLSAYKYLGLLWFWARNPKWW